MKSGTGNFFEDFRIGQEFLHVPSRTLTGGDAALYKAIYGTRFALQASEVFATVLGFASSPLDDLLVFHTIFGMSVNEISLNAIANLGYAELRFAKRVHAGATLRAKSTVIGLKENSDGKTGIVFVRTLGLDEMDDEVLSFARWVMVRKRDAGSKAPETVMPQFASFVAPEHLSAPDVDFAQRVRHHAGDFAMWEDYEIGEKIDHVDGTTIEEAEHAMATRLTHNNARVHFNQFSESQGRFGKRIVYGGHVISIARALSYNGLQNAHHIAAINAGRHVGPVFAGDTIYAWSQVLDKSEIEDNDRDSKSRKDCAALRLRLVATKNLPCDAFPDQDIVLDLDYWAVVPRR